MRTACENGRVIIGNSIFTVHTAERLRLVRDTAIVVRHAVVGYCLISTVY